jgi:hypothetical protein
MIVVYLLGMYVCDLLMVNRYKMTKKRYTTCVSFVLFFFVLFSFVLFCFVIII